MCYVKPVDMFLRIEPKLVDFMFVAPSHWTKHSIHINIRSCDTHTHTHAHAQADSLEYLHIITRCRYCVSCDDFTVMLMSRLLKSVYWDAERQSLLRNMLTGCVLNINWLICNILHEHKPKNPVCVYHTHTHTRARAHTASVRIALCQWYPYIYLVKHTHTHIHTYTIPHTYTIYIIFINIPSWFHQLSNDIINRM